MLAPDTSHGTNPASVTMAGYEVVKVATNERGGVDMDDLRARIEREGPDQIACLMLTNPNTLGLFDPNIVALKMYQQLSSGESGRASALAVVLLACTLPVMVYNIRRFREQEAQR